MAAQDLIPVFTGPIQDQPQLLCDARALHAYLQVRRDFATWIKDRIKQYGFVEATSPPHE
ncbi:antA/AntB antirepressor family protein [Chitinolyticbacter meiyuanensis]|uniref:antA/AntB antirepressor family protein n=1 Tax=Chitinolyticbacter meiyuanensis TaxID=682798 RepID=UPI0011E5F07C|nr:antA/AntB antirepressor family protein [Chitinolyticbacter meiyuanensis]